MAGGLSAFFAQNVKKPENAKVVVSTRFTDETGSPMLWEVRPLTSGEDEQLRKQFTRLVPVPGKSNQFRQEFDANGYLTALTAKSTVFPNLNDKELQDSYGAMSAQTLLKEMLTAGEAANYMQHVQEINGFTPLEDQVEQAKN